MCNVLCRSQSYKYTADYMYMREKIQKQVIFFFKFWSHTKTTLIGYPKYKSVILEIPPS